MACESEWQTFLAAKDAAQQTKVAQQAAADNAEQKNAEKVAAEEAAQEALQQVKTANENHTAATEEMDAAYLAYSNCVK